MNAHSAGTPENEMLIFDLVFKTLERWLNVTINPSFLVKWEAPSEKARL